MAFEQFATGIANALSGYLGKKNEMAAEKERRKGLLDLVLSEEDAKYKRDQARRPAEMKQKIDEVRQMAELHDELKTNSAKHILEQWEKLNPEEAKISENRKIMENHAYGFAAMLPRKAIPEYMKPFLSRKDWNGAVGAAKNQDDIDLIGKIRKATNFLAQKPTLVGGGKYQVLTDPQGNPSLKRVPGFEEPARGGHGGGRGAGTGAGQNPGNEPVKKWSKDQKTGYDKYGNIVVDYTTRPELRIQEIDKQLKHFQNNVVPKSMTLFEWSNEKSSSIPDKTKKGWMGGETVIPGKKDPNDDKKQIVKQLLQEREDLLLGRTNQPPQPAGLSPYLDSRTGTADVLANTLVAPNSGTRTPATMPQHSDPSILPAMGGMLGQYFGGAGQQPVSKVKARADAARGRKNEKSEKIKQETNRKVKKLDESWRR